MKKILFASNILFISIATFFYVQSCSSTPQPTTCSQKICKDYSDETFVGMDAGMAKRMSAAYARDEWKRAVNDPAPGFGNDDATSIWFDLETIKKFLWKVEHEICKEGCDSLQLGLRLYYAKYPEPATMSVHNDLRGLNDAFTMRHTIFMVPTYRDGKAHIDFDPWHLGPNKCRPTPFQAWFYKNTDSLMFSGASLLMGITSEGYVQNHGDLAPPPSGTGTFGN